MDDLRFRPHSSHWGAFSAAYRDGEVLIRPDKRDPDPSPLLQNFTDGLRHHARIATPMVREGWLRHGPGPDSARGRSRFIPMSWDAVLDRLGGELARVSDRYGPQAVYGGSYGWSSAGRFHHAQSQIHRFLNTACGGYVRSVGSYSAGASTTLLPHILGPFEAVTRRNVTWDQIAAHTDLVGRSAAGSRR
jgi:biotin/methionine sulfoxide reductase